MIIEGGDGEMGRGWRKGGGEDEGREEGNHVTRLTIGRTTLIKMAPRNPTTGHLRRTLSQSSYVALGTCHTPKRADRKRKQESGGAGNRRGRKEGGRPR